MGNQCGYRQGPEQWDCELLIETKEGKLQSAEHFSHWIHQLQTHRHRVSQGGISPPEKDPNQQITEA